MSGASKVFSQSNPKKVSKNSSPKTNLNVEKNLSFSKLIQTGGNENFVNCLRNKWDRSFQEY